MTVELRHLRAFLALAEEGSITRAAVAAALDPAELVVRPLRTEPRVAAVPADSPLAAPGRAPLTLDDLADLPLAVNTAVGVTATATAQAHRHHSVAYVPLAGAPAVPVVLAWRDPPGHPAVPALLTLAHRVAGEAAQEPTGPGSR